MTLKSGIYILAFVCILLCTDSQARDCNVLRFRATWGLEMPANMYVVKNKQCEIRVLSTGQSSITIEQQAKNGTATAEQS